MKIERISANEVNNLRGYLEGVNTPIIITDLFKSWPALEIAKNSDEKILRYLINHAKPRLVDTLIIDDKYNGLIGYTDDTFKSYTFKKYDAPFSSVIKKMIIDLKSNDKTKVAVQSALIKECLTSFLDKNPSPDFLKDIEPRIWLGNSASVPGHYDCDYNIALNLCGKRTFYLLPTESINDIYVAPIDKSITGPAISLVDFEQPNLKKFPKFSKVKDDVLKASLNEGEALFIPPLWWHNVKATERINILINYWWKDEVSNKILGCDPSDSLLHSILTIRHLPTEQKESWKKLFDHYIFENTKYSKNEDEGCNSILDGDINQMKMAFEAIKEKLKTN
ncbi:cupin-like domain-containing protein [Pseudoalteromonas atlantica]|uniref:cupin-like domain-containing protein n=1 Tax=Pseudoalteromonas atlantica TaxID=288 RepID=UPI00373626E2